MHPDPTSATSRRPARRCHRRPARARRRNSPDGETRAETADVAEYALWLGDDALILSQQLGAWIAHAPELEEDVALGNIALDLLGHARSLLRYAGTFDGRSEDDLAYWRDEPRVPQRVAVRAAQRRLRAHDRTPAGGIRVPCSSCTPRCGRPPDATLAAIAEKAVKEVDYHRDHAVQWTLRLAGGTDESRRRMIRAIGDVWPYVDELFRDEPLTDRLSERASPCGRRRCVRVSTPSSRPCSPRPSSTVPDGLRRRPAAGATAGTSPTLGLSARRDAGARAAASGGDMVTVLDARRSRARASRRRVKDPEVPVLTIEDLGVLRDVQADGDRVTVTITPTYSRMPRDGRRSATTRARAVGGRLRRGRGAPDALARVDDGLDDGCRQAKLTEYGIAPPTGRARRRTRSAGARRCGAPAAVRSTPGRSRGSARPRARRCTSAARAWSRSTTSRCTDVLKAAGDPVERRGRGSAASPTPPRSPTRSSRVPSGGPTGPAGARASTPCAVAEVRPAHRLVDRGDLRRSRRALAASSTTSPGSTSRCAPMIDGREVRRSYSLCRPPATGSATGTADRSASRSSATSAADSRPGR